MVFEFRYLSTIICGIKTPKKTENKEGVKLRNPALGVVSNYYYGRVYGCFIVNRADL